MTLVLEIKHSKCVVSCIILPHALGKMIQYTGQNDTVRLFSSQIQIFKTLHRNNYKHNQTIYNAIYRHGNMIEHEQFSDFSESHLLPFMFYVLPRGKMIQLTTNF